jgi:hypothetical protein
VVSDSPFRAVSAADGSFAFDQVPPGRYRIELVHEYLGRAERTVEVSSDRVTRVEFALPAPAKPFLP